MLHGTDHVHAHVKPCLADAIAFSYDAHAPRLKAAAHRVQCFQNLVQSKHEWLPSIITSMHITASHQHAGHAHGSQGEVSRQRTHPCMFVVLQCLLYPTSHSLLSF